MDKELRKAIRKILDDLTRNSKDERFDPRLFTSAFGPPNSTGSPVKAIDCASIVDVNAAEYLTLMGCLNKCDDSQYRLTAQGWEYWERHRFPWSWLWFLFKANWFPAIVAVGTIITSVASVVQG